MWERGEINYNGTTYYWEAKVYDEPSEFGIDNGRISKLCVSLDPSLGLNSAVINYDRGWDIYPETEEEHIIFAQIMHMFE